MVIYKVHNLPERVRVGIWRRIKKIGAIYLQKSVIIVPDTTFLKNEMENLVHDIDNFGGETYIIFSSQIEKETKLINEFKNNIKEEYENIRNEVKTLNGQLNQNTTVDNYSELEKKIRILRSNFSQIKRRDFFGVREKESTEALLVNFENELYKLVTK